MTNDIFAQAPFRCKLDWGRIGAERAARRGDIIVIVDVLSFSTTVTHAVRQGAIVYPRREDEEIETSAARLGAEIAVGRTEVPSNGRYSLSPLTFNNVAKGTRVLLPSLNGATCTRCAESSDAILIGALVNAEAVSRSISNMLNVSDRDVTVIACGEREKGAQPPLNHYELRMAIEDYLGAGAILSRLSFPKSPEAQVCQAAFESNSSRIDELIRDSVSGRELREIGFGDDVSFAIRMNVSDTVPVLKNGAFRDSGVDVS